MAKLKIVKCHAHAFGKNCKNEVVGTWTMPNGEEQFFCDKCLRLIDRSSIRDAAKYFEVKD